MQTRMNIAVLLLLSLCCPVFPDMYAKIVLGENIDQLGFINEGETIWYPVFFCTDTDGNIHIPDFYKGRIAVFSPGGKLLKSVRTACISPRMNVFLRNAEGKYIVIDSGNLYVLDAAGKPEWEYQFPPGFIPDAVYAIENYIYVLSPAGDAETPGKAVYAFECGSNQLIGILGKEIGGRIVPVIIASEKLMVSDTLYNAQLLNGNELSEGAEDIIFLARDLNGTSWWYNRKNPGIYRDLIVSPDFIPAASVPRNHVWLWISDDGKIYHSGKADADEKVIEIYRAGK
ncbi:MAG: hypothetical protein JW874_01910 [Spirochaetales bacterium]|nr:hypothetical protein [Spirochaetales bacterium]